MNKLISFILFVFLCHSHVLSQIRPREGSNLNYRIIGFTFPALQNVTDYGLEIASGYINSKDSFSKNRIVSLDSRTNKIVAEVPSFGEQYTWRVIFTIGHAKVEYGELHHFSTKYSRYTDTNISRLRILSSTEQYKNAYVFLDDNKVLYDMKGHPVWFLPTFDTLLNESYQPRDIKITPSGTITLIVIDKVYEVNYNGQILWKNPNNGFVSGDTAEHFHHEFTKMSNGHYLALGSEQGNVYLADSGSGQAALRIVANKDIAKTNALHPNWRFFRKDQFATIIEYDEKGHILSSYKSSGYFDGSDLVFRKDAEGKLDTKVHDNAFYLDEKKGELYISFKDISRIIKIKYPEGTLLNTYGALYNPGAIQNKGKDLFCGQHAAKISAGGNLYLFNNNDCNWPALPIIEVLKQPLSSQDSLKKIWEYQCTVEDMEANERKALRLTTGGNVIELPDQSLFVSMGNGYSKLFIVTKDKEILWSALSERYDSYLKKWEPATLYRASIVTDEEYMDHLIWNTETGK